VERPLSPQGEAGTPSAKRAAAPLWLFPATLALLGIVLAVGRLDLVRAVTVSVECGLFLVYLGVRLRRGRRKGHGIMNALGLFPGHLVLLLAASLLSPPVPWLVDLWLAVPPLCVLYDAVALRAGMGSRLRMSTLAGVYCILWAVLFALAERLIVIGRQLTGTAEKATGGAFLLVGVLFLSLGVYRHWAARNVKE
jgi:threonine/homoserine/homoserine lactone efflux protein